MVVTKQVKFKSHNPALKLMDITPKVEKVVKESKITDGQVLVFARHTTAAIVLQENEPKLHRDLHNLLYKLAPKEEDYRHNSAPDHLADGMPNGHAHCHHVLLGASEIIPLSKGKLLLGRYQRIFLAELDRSREREIVIQIVG